MATENLETLTALPQETEPVAEVGAASMKHPNVLLVDFQKEVLVELRKNRFNVDEATFGVKYSSAYKESEAHFSHRMPLIEEREILIINCLEPEIEATEEEVCQEDKEVKGKRFEWYKPSSQNYFNPRPLVSSWFESNVNKILKLGGIVITVASDKYFENYLLYEIKNGMRVSLNEREQNNFDFLPFSIDTNTDVLRRTETRIAPDCPPLFQALFQKYKKSFTHITSFLLGPNDIPLLTDKFGDIVSFVHGVENEEGTDVGLVLFLPPSSSQGKLLVDLLTTVLPISRPKLFPDIVQSSWMKNKQYLPPSLLQLHSKKVEIEQDYSAKIDEANKEIEDEEKRYQFLFDILSASATDDVLVKALEAYLKKIGFDCITVVDDVKEGINEEDLQIYSLEELTVVEVKGIYGIPSDNNCQRVLKYMLRRQREQSERVYGLFVVNHQKNLPPLERSNPPFTTEQISDAEGSYSLVTTWQLFNAYLAYEREELSTLDIDACLKKTGLVDFMPRTWKRIGEVSHVYPQAGAVTVELVDGPI